MLRAAWEGKVDEARAGRTRGKNPTYTSSFLLDYAAISDEYFSRNAFVPKFCNFYVYYYKLPPTHSKKFNITFSRANLLLYYSGSFLIKSFYKK